MTPSFWYSRLRSSPTDHTPDFGQLAAPPWSLGQQQRGAARAPEELAGRALLTDEEVAALQKKEAELFASGDFDAAFGDQVFASVFANANGTRSGFKSTDCQTGDYSSVWLPKRDWDRRTSLITDPPDGCLPPITAEANGSKRLQRQCPAGFPKGRRTAR